MVEQGDVNIKRVRLEEALVGDHRLGRHVEHDPRSRDFPFLGAGAPVPPLKSVLHKRHGTVFNQGNLGSCTGNAAAGAVNTEPLYHADFKKLLHEVDAINLYELATVLDGYPGQYPPDDSGSSGLAAAKAAQQKGYIKSYRHAFSIDEALSALMTAPVITGVSWYEGFDHPDANGLVAIAGQVRGGHEFEIVGLHLDTTDPFSSVVEATNSWGTSWGKSGRFFFTVSTWSQLLADQGDVTVLLP